MIGSSAGQTTLMEHDDQPPNLGSEEDSVFFFKICYAILSVIFLLPCSELNNNYEYKVGCDKIGFEIKVVKRINVKETKGKIQWRPLYCWSVMNHKSHLSKH